MEWYLPVIWAGADRHRGRALRDPRRLRSRHRHPVSRSPRTKERDQMINSIAPFWDGNETWLVLGGGGLWVAFPQAYAVMMPALYLPVIVMLLGADLPRRRVRIPHRRGYQQEVLEFRVRRRLDARGVLPGTDPRRADPGHQGRERRSSPAARSISRRRSRCCAGFGVVDRLRAARRVLAGDEDGRRGRGARARARQAVAARRARLHGGGEPVDAACNSRASRERWFSLPNILFSGRCRSITALTAFLAWRWLEQGREIRRSSPRSCCSCSAMPGWRSRSFRISCRHSITVWDAAAAPASQIFMLLGTLPLLPIILIYTGFVYYLFRGKLQGRRRVPLGREPRRRLSPLPEGQKGAGSDNPMVTKSNQ